MFHRFQKKSLKLETVTMSPNKIESKEVWDKDGSYSLTRYLKNEAARAEFPVAPL